MDAVQAYNWQMLMEWCWTLGIDVELRHQIYSYHFRDERQPVLRFRKGDKQSMLVGRNLAELFLTVGSQNKKIAADLCIPELKFKTGE